MSDSRPSDASQESGLEDLARDNIRAVARNLGRGIESAAGNGAAELKKQADTRVRTGTHFASQQLLLVASAINNAATESDMVDSEQADRAASAAQRINQFAATVEQQNIDTLTAEARKLARRNPMVAAGAAAALGVLIGRFIQSAGDERPRK